MKNIVKNIKAWKSTVLGLLVILLIAVGVATGKVTEEVLLGFIPALMLVFTNWFGERKPEDVE